MLEIPYIRQNKDQVIKALQKRGIDASADIDNLISADDRRKEFQVKTDGIQAEIKSLSKSIGGLFKEGKTEEANQQKERVASLKEELNAIKEQAQQNEDAIKKHLYDLPNAPHDSVPPGKSDADNEVISENKSEINLPTNAKPHWELCEEHNLIDFELGVKITGAGFPVYRGKGAKLQRALIQYFLDKADQAGYEEMIPPHVVNEASGIGTGQLPDKEGQMYHVGTDDLYLIPTAEVPLTNVYRDVLIKDDKELPIKICGYTPCFRREAGSYGKDVRGLNRLHQFDKVEIVRIEKPEDSFNALDEMISHVENILKELELPYRILRLCGGDLGFASSITYDFEVYSAAQERWLEVSSVSNFKSFQSNRLKLRFKNQEGKNTLLHTLNGSALALPRILAAILENYQTEDGINIPKVLQRYVGFEKI
ncbi:serine--tRNA ligase [Luteibaculum oceani]|uniref:Serine--tRNA ligase n=1 Tax=Luteibaculum oceani TaxID=1294296 RepID=A0A5C6VB40_9FLAO|nr:serine--tRNA ligase [Luteibaculum oceani]TXC81821.1 serine--tRNA ligase [Luteibaculum oceani]